jgi:hypothetical protein
VGGRALVAFEFQNMKCPAKLIAHTNNKDEEKQARSKQEAITGSTNTCIYCTELFLLRVIPNSASGGWSGTVGTVLVEIKTNEVCICPPRSRAPLRLAA